MAGVSPQVPVPPPSEQMASALSTISAQARQTNVVRARDLRTALVRARTGELDAAGWAAAQQTAHQLAGSAGTFGYAGVSELARSLEQLLAGADVSVAAPALLQQGDALLDQVLDQLAREPEVD